MPRRFAVVLLLVLFAGCAQPPVRDELTLDFGDDESLTVTAETVFDLDTKSRAAQLRVEDARAAALAGTDAWAVRFARLDPEVDRFTQQRRHGALERVSRTVVIGADDVQQVFSDANITARYARSAARCELTLFPGTSSRASREQRQRFDDELEAWSKAVARYYTAIRHLYAYMNANPQRARYLYAFLLNEKGADGAPPLVLEDEQPLVDAVVDAMDDVAARLDAEQADASTLAEEADLIFNPFPARLKVRVPGTVTSSEGFGPDLVVEPIELIEIVAKLEGKWISPDPLAALLREQELTAEALAREPRSAEQVVNGSDIAAAVRAELTRPRLYAVRWRC